VYIGKAASIWLIMLCQLRYPEEDRSNLPQSLWGIACNRTRTLHRQVRDEGETNVDFYGKITNLQHTNFVNTRHNTQPPHGIFHLQCFPNVPSMVG